MYAPPAGQQSPPRDLYNGEGSSLLDELDKFAPIKSFDAFPKVCPLAASILTSAGAADIYRPLKKGRLVDRCRWIYYFHSRLGKWTSCHVCTVLRQLMLQNDLGEFLYGAPTYSFRVDPGLEEDLQLNVDLTVAMPCQCKHAVGVRLTCQISRSISVTPSVTGCTSATTSTRRECVLVLVLSTDWADSKSKLTTDRLQPGQSHIHEVSLTDARCCTSRLAR